MGIPPLVPCTRLLTHAYPYVSCSLSAIRWLKGQSRLLPRLTPSSVRINCAACGKDWCSLPCVPLLEYPTLELHHPNQTEQALGPEVCGPPAGLRQRQHFGTFQGVEAAIR